MTPRNWLEIGGISLLALLIEAQRFQLSAEP